MAKYSLIGLRSLFERHEIVLVRPLEWSGTSHEWLVVRRKEQFLSKINPKQLVLNAAAIADKLGLWRGSRAKVEYDQPIGVHGKAGFLTNIVNIYRTNTNVVHVAPGSPND